MSRGGTARLDVPGLDPARWLAAVPSAAKVPGVTRLAAESLWASSEVRPRRGEVRHCAGVLAFAVEGYARLEPDLDLHLHLDGPRGDPLAVYTGHFQAVGDPEAELRAFTHADDPDYAVEPPLVDEFATPHLGTGHRVLRHYVSPEHGIITALRYAWHLPDHDTYVIAKTSSPEPPRVLTALDDIDAFVRALRFLP